MADNILRASCTLVGDSDKRYKFDCPIVMITLESKEMLAQVEEIEEPLFDEDLDTSQPHYNNLKDYIDNKFNELFLLINSSLQKNQQYDNTNNPLDPDISIVNNNIDSRKLCSSSAQESGFSSRVEGHIANNNSNINHPFSRERSISGSPVHNKNSIHRERLTDTRASSINQFSSSVNVEHNKAHHNTNIFSKNIDSSTHHYNDSSSLYNIESSKVYSRDLQGLDYKINELGRNLNIIIDGLEKIRGQRSIGVHSFGLQGKARPLCHKKL